MELVRMDQAQFERAREILAAARDVPAAGRAAWARAACGPDAALAAEVLSLLEFDVTSRLDRPAMGAGFHVASGLGQDEPAGPPAPASTPIPARIGKYAVTEALDDGGQARVYRAVHPTLASEVVVKLAHDPAAAAAAGADAALMDTRMLGALAEEGRILAGLAHPNVARVFDLDVCDDGRPYLVMEYVRGRNLAQVADGRAMRPADAARIVAQAARGLGAAHRAGVVHLDVKPGNVMVSDAGVVKVIDFGAARLRDAWRPAAGPQGMATPRYMAPELLDPAAGEPGPRTDVFALGCVLFFLLTGRQAYPGTDLPDVLARARAGRFDRAALDAAPVPGRLRAICLRAMSAAPGGRQADADAMAEDLERFARPRNVRAWVAATSLAAAIVAAVVVIAGRRGPAGANPPAPSPSPSPAVAQAQADAVPIDVLVFRHDGWVPMEAAGPLSDGDHVRMDAVIPAGLYASMLNQNPSGEIEELATLRPGDAGRTLSFPPPGEKVELARPSGTEVVVVLTRRDGPVDVARLKAAWPTPGGWPALPAGASGRVVRGKVQLTHGDRFGVRTSAPDPTDAVRQRLADLDATLRADARDVSAVVFTHAPVRP